MNPPTGVEKTGLEKYDPGMIESKFSMHGAGAPNGVFGGYNGVCANAAVETANIANCMIFRMS